MKKLIATIEKASDGGYGVYLTNEMFSGMGATPSEAKKDMIDSIRFYVTTCREDGHHYPKWMDEDYQIVYQFDTQSLLKYYRGIFTKAALERITGINQKQLGAYEAGTSRPRPAQARKIENALHALGEELISISL